jgi:hypothetical protein
MLHLLLTRLGSVILGFKGLIKYGSSSTFRTEWAQANRVGQLNQQTKWGTAPTR